MGLLIQIVFSAVIWALSKAERRRNEEREYQTGLAHGRAERHAELAAWINLHHPHLLKDFPKQ